MSENKCNCNQPYDSEKHEGGYPACPVHDKPAVAHEPNLAVIGHGTPAINHDRVIANQLAGMSLEEAIFQDGYSAGVDFEKKRRKPGSVWVKASERLPANDMTDDFPCEYALKCKNDGDRGQVIYESGNCADIAHMLQTSGYDVIYWLDESGAAPSVEISQDAHEKEVMMNAFNEVRRIFEGRVWIMEGRGSYPYNDDRYREEVRYMYNEFDELHKNTWANIKSHSSEYRHAIIEQYLKEKGESAPSGEREDWIDVNDRLPEEGGRYWCYVEHQGDLGISHFQWNCYYSPNLHRFSDRTLTDGEQVTHWRELPPPPKQK